MKYFFLSLAFALSLPAARSQCYDTSFGNNGIAANNTSKTGIVYFDRPGTVDIVKMMPEGGKMLLFGNSDNTDIYIASHDADGTFSSGFGTGGRILFDAYADDRYVDACTDAAGNIYLLRQGNGQYFITKFSPGGIPETGFGTNGSRQIVFSDPSVYSDPVKINTDPSGNIWISGNSKWHTDSWASVDSLLLCIKGYDASGTALSAGDGLQVLRPQTPGGPALQSLGLSNCTVADICFTTANKMLVAYRIDRAGTTYDIPGGTQTFFDAKTTFLCRLNANASSTDNAFSEQMFSSYAANGAAAVQLETDAAGNIFFANRQDNFSGGSFLGFGYRFYILDAAGNELMHESFSPGIGNMPVEFNIQNDTLYLLGPHAFSTGSSDYQKFDFRISAYSIANIASPELIFQYPLERKWNELSGIWFDPLGKSIYTAVTDPEVAGEDYGILRMNYCGAHFTSPTAAGMLSLNKSGVQVLRDSKKMPGGGFVQVSEVHGGVNNTYDHRQLLLQKFDNNGMPDLSFGNGGTMQWIGSGFRSVKVYAADVTPDNGIVVLLIMYRDRYQGTGKKMGLVKFKADGTYDKNFGIDGYAIFPGDTVLGEDPNDVLSLESGKILMAAHHKLFRFGADGTVDTTYGTAGRYPIPGITNPQFQDYYDAGLYELPDQRIAMPRIAHPNFNPYTTPRIEVIFMLPDGGIDSTVSFENTGKYRVQFADSTFATGFHWSAQTARILSDGSVIIAGYNDSIDHNYQYNMIITRFGPDGTPYAPYGNGSGVHIITYHNDIALTDIDITPDEKTIYTIMSRGTNLVTSAYHLADLQPDTSFCYTGTMFKNFQSELNPLSGRIINLTDGSRIITALGKFGVNGDFERKAVALKIGQEILTTSIPDQHIPEIHVFPNPSSSIIHIEADAKIISARLYSMQGARCITGNNELPVMNVSSLAPGVYVLHVGTEKGTATRKVVITR